jgi:hypothetical protein
MSVIGFQADWLSAAKGISSQTDITRAVEIALSLKIPFRSKRLKISADEDMYVRALDCFPVGRIESLERNVLFGPGRFYEESPAYLEEAEPETFRLTNSVSLVYHRFLESDLRGERTLRGQRISPVSLELKSADQDQKPIFYRGEVRDGLGCPEDLVCKDPGELPLGLMFLGWFLWNTRAHLV